MKSENNVNSSLELLLDTICNTFGGILFISMLVIIMTNVTSRQASLNPPSEFSQAELLEVERELESSRRQLMTLQKSLVQQAAIARQVVDPDARELAQRVTALKQQRTALTEHISLAVESAGLAQAAVNETARDLARLDEALATAKSALRTAEESLRQEVAARSRVARLPKLHETTKRQIGFLLKAGRLTSYAARDRDGHLVPNLEDFISSTLQGQDFIEPKPGRGIAVAAGEAETGEIARKLAEFDSREHYVAIAVWPDSFEHFAIVKAALVLAGFEYHLLPMQAGKIVSIGPTTGKVLVQ